MKFRINRINYQKELSKAEKLLSHNGITVTGLANDSGGKPYVIQNSNVNLSNSIDLLDDYPGATYTV